MAAVPSIGNPPKVEISRPPRPDDLLDLELVENSVSLPPSQEEDDQPELRVYREEQTPRRDTTADQLAVPTDAVANLRLPQRSIDRAAEVKRAFDHAGPESDVGERLLEELVSGELAVALELENTEAALITLLQKTITDPTLATAVAKLTREVFGLSGAVRHRIQGSLGAIAGLRAQRALLTTHRARSGGRLGE
jgi:hypothetical protein